MASTLSHEPLGSSFRRLVLSSGFSNLADGIFKIGLPLVAVTFTRSPAVVAGLELVRTLPWLLGALPAGALVDRLDRRRTMLASNIVRSMAVAAPAVTLATGQGSMGLLYTAAVATGVAEVFYDTAAQSLVPSVVGRSQLERANGRLYAVELGAQEFLGPPIAGVLVAAALAVSFATSAALWIVAIGVLLAVRGEFLPIRAHQSTSIRADIQEGLSFLFNRPVLGTMALMVGMTNLATSATFAVLVLFAVGPDSAMQLTEPEFGLLIATLAVGALIGGLLAEQVQRRIGRAHTLTVSVLGMAAYTVTPAITANVAAIATTMLVSGITTMMWNVTTVSFRQRVTPDHLLGRLNSVYRLVAWGTRPLGAALGGVIGQWLGIRWVYAVMGILAAAVLIPNRRLTEQALTAGEHQHPRP